MADFERIITSAPVSAQAAKQMSKGEAPQDRNWSSADYADCPPLKPITAEMKSSPMFVDFTGGKFGRLTAIGLLEKPSGRKRKASWVLRCTCGNFTLRPSRSLRNFEDSEGFVDRCGPCDWTRKLRNKPPLWRELHDAEAQQ